jgi:hypothetical protein
MKVFVARATGVRQERRCPTAPTEHGGAGTRGRRRGCDLLRHEAARRVECQGQEGTGIHPQAAGVVGWIGAQGPGLERQQFLVKDLALLGISLCSLGEAWQASEQGDHQIT